MPFIQISPFADPFAPRRSYGRCGGRRQQQQQQQQQQATGCPAQASSSSSFNPLADLLSAFEKEFSTPEPQTQQRPKTYINPKFDIVETKDAFILQGELPGVVDKKLLDIQFRDAQTIVVKGEVARRSFGNKGKEPEEQQTEAQADESLPQYEEKPSTASSVTTEPSDNASTRSYQPTMEETVDESESGSENDFEVVELPSASRIVAPKPTPSPAPVTVSEKQAPVEKVEQPQPQPQPQPAQVQPPQQPSPKFWLSERSIGIFERAFTFQSLIDQEGVTATLEDGILEVVIPKREAYVRRVQIQ